MVVHRRRDPLRGNDHTARGHSGEDPLIRREITQRLDRLCIAHEELPVEDTRVEDLWDEPFLKRTQALDTLSRKFMYTPVVVVMWTIRRGFWIALIPLFECIVVFHRKYEK